MAGSAFWEVRQILVSKLLNELLFKADVVADCRTQRFATLFGNAVRDGDCLKARRSCARYSVKFMSDWHTLLIVT